MFYLYECFICVYILSICVLLETEEVSGSPRVGVTDGVSDHVCIGDPQPLQEH